MVVLVTRVAVAAAPAWTAWTPVGAGVVTETGAERAEWLPLPSKASTVYW